MVKLTKKELQEQRRTQWQEKQKQDIQSAKIRKFGIWGAVAAGFLIFAGLLIWLVSSPTPTTPDIKIAAVSAKDIQTGPKDAKATLVEYADFQCPGCRAYNSIVTQLAQNYKGKMNYVYRFFPLSMHQNGMISAQAGYAAYLQGKFWEMDKMLFDNQDAWATATNPKEVFTSYAQKIGIDVEKFKKDIDAGSTKKAIEDSVSEGTTAGINSTPSFILNGKLITSPKSVEEFKKLIDEALKAK